MSHRASSAIVVIPARGGSQGVKLKNLQKVGGISLVGRAVQASLAAPSVAAVVVSTDHDGIAAEARAHGAVVIDRPAELSGGSASSESAVLHALDVIESGHTALASTALPPVTVLLQATSPFIAGGDLEAAIRHVAEGSKDVVIAVAETHDFQWRMDEGGVAPVGHSTEYRPRRQDRPAHFRETGAFYAMRTTGLRAAGVRFFGEIGLQVTSPQWSIEIDEPRDLWLSRQLVHQPSNSELARDLDEAAASAIDVDALVTDFDGVHTDDRAFVDESGLESVSVSRSDGMGVSRLRDAGVPMLILSTEVNRVVATRAEKLRVQVMHGVEDKAAALRCWIEQSGLDAGRVAYLGNDVNDLDAMACVGWPIAVSDARPEVHEIARVVLSRTGGRGAVREVCDRILAARAT